MKNLFLLSIISVVLLLHSCDKHRAKKLSGSYTCQVERTCFGGCNTPDSSYIETVEVTSEGKDIVLFNSKIHVDNFKNGKTYEPHSYFNVTFGKNTLEIYSRSGGLGCSCEYNYDCEK